MSKNRRAKREELSKHEFAGRFISKAAAIESKLVELGAREQGLGKKLNELQHKIPGPTRDSLSELNEVRNQIVHERNYQFDGNKKGMLSRADRLIHSLEKLAEPCKKQPKRRQKKRKVSSPYRRLPSRQQAEQHGSDAKSKRSFIIWSIIAGIVFSALFFYFGLPWWVALLATWLGLAFLQSAL
jgi:hypothetical protein